MAFGRARKQPAPLDAARLFDYAVKSLGRAMRTEAGMRRLMKARVEPDEHGDAVVEAVILRLKEYGYLDDVSFAETYARLRQENEKFGERRVRQDMKQKGVPDVLIAETLEARYGQTDEVSLARAHLDRKRLKKPENDKEIARIMRRLIAAGFSTTAIRTVLRQWEVPDEALSAMENLDLMDGEEGEE
jgi:regulatory protein